MSSKLKKDYQQDMTDRGLEPGNKTIDEMIVELQEFSEQNQDWEMDKKGEQGEACKKGDPGEAGDETGEDLNADKAIKESPDKAPDPKKADQPQKKESVRAKFKLYNIIPLPSGPSQYEFTAVNGSEENKSFSDQTPTGTICISVTEGSEAHKLLELNKEYFLDISKAE